MVRTESHPQMLLPHLIAGMAMIAMTWAWLLMPLGPANGAETAPDTTGAIGGPSALGEDNAGLIPENFKPSERKALLTRLYARLKKAADEEAAKPIILAIEKLWLVSGSDTIDFLMQNALTAVGEEDLDVARELLDRVIELRPNYTEAWNKRAMIFFMKEDFTRTIEDLHRVLAMDPNHFQAIQGLALVMQEIGDKKSALRAFRALLRVHPNLESARRAAQELEREVEGQGI